MSMIKKHIHNNLVWVDLESPTELEVQSVMREYDLHPLIAEELVTPTSKPKAERYKNCLYCIFHFPTLKRGPRSDSAKEIDFVIGRDFIITSRFATVEPILAFSKMFEVNSILEKEAMGNHAGLIFYYMMRKLYRHVGLQMEHVKGKLCDAENNIFEGKEKEMVVELSTYGRELLDFKEILIGHEETLDSLEKHVLPLLGQEFAPFINTIRGDYQKALGIVLTNKEFLNDLRDTNDSLLTTKQNETMKVLTMMAFITFPLSLITEIFSMNTSHAPILGQPLDFEIIITLMVVATLVMFGVFKYKKWL